MLPSVDSDLGLSFNHPLTLKAQIDEKKNWHNLKPGMEWNEIK